METGFLGYTLFAASVLLFSHKILHLISARTIDRSHCALIIGFVVLSFRPIYGDDVPSFDDVHIGAPGGLFLCDMQAGATDRIPDFRNGSSMTAMRARCPRSFNLAAAAFFLASLVSHAHGAEQAASRDTPKLGRGINILGYDGILGRRPKLAISPGQFDRDQEGRVRACQDQFLRLQVHGPGNVMDEIILRRLDAVIEEVLARKLVPIVDEHDTHLCQRDVSECAEKLKAFWRQIAERYAGKYPALVFEVLNGLAEQ